MYIYDIYIYMYMYMYIYRNTHVYTHVYTYTHIHSLHCLVCDFGLAAVNIEGSATGRGGTPGYWAPELIPIGVFCVCVCVCVFLMCC
jgi:hypothetical protein